MLKRISKKEWSGLGWLWVTALILFLDRLTKYGAFHFLKAYIPRPVFSFFNLTLAYNRGAAFSLFDHASGWQTWVLSSLAVIVIVSILIWLKFLSFQQRWMGIALSMILGGAIGNLWDRLYFGYVIDFLEFHISYFYWPAFNIADSAICIGAFMIFWDAVFMRKRFL